MLQTLERERALLDEFLTMEIPRRVQGMRERFFNRKSAYTIERDRIEVRVMKEHLNHRPEST